MIRQFLFFALFGALFITSGSSEDKPNIVMFLIDDQDLNQLSVYGGSAPTPNLKKMAEDGILFNQAYVSSTVCTPSRYSFLTGRYAGSAYDKSYLRECPKGKQGFVSFNMGLEEDNMNVGAVLSKNGYATGFVGKYHAHGSEGHSDNHKYGLKEIPKDIKDLNVLSQIFHHNEKIHRKLIKERGFTWVKNVYWGNMVQPFSEHNPEWTMDAALEFIEEHKSQPFYLHYCSTLLHGPNKSWWKSLEHPDVTGEGIVKQRPEIIKARKALLAKIKSQGFNEDHFGIAWIDANLGILMKKLKELGLEKNTLIVFAPDHGSSNKGSVYSHNGCKIPMIMKWPAQIPAGIQSNVLVQNIDMVPTFFDIAKADVPKEYKMHGQSLKVLFKNGQTSEWRDHLYFEIGSARAVMTNEFKYITKRFTSEHIANIKKARSINLPKLLTPLNRLGIGARGVDHPDFWKEDQLYALKADPKEMKNKISNPEYANIVKDMKAKLIKVLQSMNRPYGEFIPGSDTSGPGQIDAQITLVEKLEVKGKKVTVPNQLKADFAKYDASKPKSIDGKVNSPRERKAKKDKK